jgi:hypothetical protein
MLPDDATARTLIEKGIPADQHETHVWGYTRMLVSKIAQRLGFYKLGSEYDELLSAAYLVVVRDVVPGYDPSKVVDGNWVNVWRAYLAQHVRGEVGREANRLRNGGTYHTRHEADHEPVMVEALPYRRDEEGFTEVAVIDPLSLIEDDDEPAVDMAAGLALLRPLERAVIRHRYGLDGCDPADVQGTSERLCITRGQVEALEASGLAKLRARLGADEVGHVEDAA